LEDNKRAHLIIKGRVQGVFFRLKTQQEAMRQGVNGWVQNRADKTVEAILEGDTKAVEAVIKWCRRGPTLAKVEKVIITWQNSGLEGLKEFKIRY